MKMAEFSNDRRGLRIAGTDFLYLSEGAYGVVFVDRIGGGRKLMRQRPDAKY
jgi:hypothetical protein